MKHPLLMVALALACGSAKAETLITLKTPPSGIAGVRSASCSASGFSADGLTIIGGCSYKTSCTARYCIPPQYTFNVTWALDGSATFGARATTRPPQSTGVSIQLGGTNGFYYSYVSTSVLGAIVAETQSTVVVWQP